MLAALVYLNALDNPFVYDDHRVVEENPTLRPPVNVWAVLLYQRTRPVVNVSYAMDRTLWGPGPFGFHLTSVLLHMVNVALLFALAWRLAEDRRRIRGPDYARFLPSRVIAFTAAALFAAHPMMTEAVGYISGRSDVLCTTTFLAAMLCARHWILAHRARWLIAALGFWGISLATKEIAVMLPFVVLCYDRLIVPPTPAERRRRLRGLLLPIFSIALFAVVVRLGIFALLEHPDSIVPRWRLALVELDVVRQYLTLMIAPSGQTIFHAVSPIDRPFSLRVLVAIAVVGGIAWQAWRVRRVHAIVTFGLFWFFLLLVPSSALVILDRGEPMAEHRVYLASCGLFLAWGEAIGWFSGRLSGARRVTRLAFRTAVAAGLVCIAAGTVLRNAVWASPVTVWLEAAYRAPDHWLPHLLLAEALQDQGRLDEAVVAYRRGLRLGPQEQLGYRKLGMCLTELGRFNEAAAVFEALQRLNPQSIEASMGLGAVAMLGGKPERARAYFLESLAKDRRNVAARQALATLEETIAGNPAEALRLCEEIQAIAPETPGNDECIQRNRSRLAGGNGG
jgi:Flp pilus assembly protein TadD